MKTYAVLRQILLLALFAFACSSSTIAYQLAPAKKQAVLPFPDSFVLISDTQYAVPFTDYDVRYQLGKQILNLPPDVTTQLVHSFYRHAEAHFALPNAFDAILAAEEQSNQRGFGLFGGDMAEFSCNAETDKMFALLANHPSLPFMIAIGNHDATFHGSYDTDAIGQAGLGPWDVYSFDLWRRVCAQRGGRLTKSGFIRQVLAYYEKVWRFDFHAALGLQPQDAYPLGRELSGSALGRGFQLDFSFRLSADDSPQSHRQSHLFQRFTRRDPPRPESKLTVTVLDTLDYGSRKILCGGPGEAVQIGLAGGITTTQLKWIENEPPVDGQHFVLSHYIPFQDIERLSADGKGERIGDCETTFGTRCLGARMQKDLGKAIYIYSHVHQGFEAEQLTKVDDKKDCDAASADLSLVRLPSLIDNKAYVVFEKGQFRNQPLPASPELESNVPFTSSSCDPKQKACALTKQCQTCNQRYLEYLELQRNVRCFAQLAVSPGAACPELLPVLVSGVPEAEKFCQFSASAWRAESKANDTNWQTLSADCKDWPTTDLWRCVLGGLSTKAVTDAGLSPSQTALFYEKLLNAVDTLPQPSAGCP
jgi:hypothetical protein